MSTRCQIEFYDDRESAAKGLTGQWSEPEARLYKHSDGYPSGVLPMLKQLGKRLSGKDTSLKAFPDPHKFLGKDDKPRTAFEAAKIYGPRLSDPEWAAAEFITMFRTPMGGNIYVSHQLHGDIEYLYRVVCKDSGLEVHVFTVEYDDEYKRKGFKEMTPAEIKAAA